MRLEGKSFHSAMLLKKCIQKVHTREKKTKKDVFFVFQRFIFKNKMLLNCLASDCKYFYFSFQMLGNPIPHLSCIPS